MISLRQLHFFLGHIDLRVNTMSCIQISAIDVVGGRITGCRSHPQSAEQLEELEDNVWSFWVTTMNAKSIGLVEAVGQHDTGKTITG